MVCVRKQRSENTAFRINMSFFEKKITIRNIIEEYALVGRKDGCLSVPVWTDVEESGVRRRGSAGS